MAGELDAAQLADLGIRRRQVRERFNLGTQQTDYQTGVATREAGRGMAGLVQQFTDQRNRLPWASAARGLLNSGIHQNNVFELGRNFNTAAADQQGRLQDTLAGFNTAREQLGTVRTGALTDLDEMETGRRIAQVAASIRASGS